TGVVKSGIVKCNSHFICESVPTMLRTTTRSSITVSIIAALAVVLAGCATSPLGNPQLQLFSPAQLAKMGTASYQKIKQETPIDTDASTNTYVNCVAHALTRQ